MIRFSVRCLGLLLLLSLLRAPAGFGAKNDWAEGSAGRSTGANRDYYNSAAKLRWQNLMGDWRDADGKAQGDKAYASTTIEDTNTPRFIEWDVTKLVEAWLNGKHQNQGFFLRTLKQGGTIVFASRENPATERHPQLVLQGEKNTVAISPEADTSLAKSTYKSQGLSEEMRVSGSSNNLLIRFDLSEAAKAGTLSQATLRLFTTRQYGAADVGVFRCAQGHDMPPSDPILGLASRYPQDQKIADDPDVLFATQFESPMWNEEWTFAGKKEVIDTTSQDAARKFEPLSEKALRVKIAKGNTGALNTGYKFQKEIGREPEEIYFRYYLRLGDDWNQTRQGGKMPGLSGTYGVAGWGGRKVNGTDGWSARGSFGLTIPEGNPLAGLHPIGTYCYHADMQGFYGSQWGWHIGYRGFLENNRWYCIEQYLKMNTPGEKDGILRAWIDGRLAFEKTDIRFRTVDKLKIEQIWMNVYHGGTEPSPFDQHLFIDNVVIAKQYIGPMKTK
jgi:hypothetical protein